MSTNDELRLQLEVANAALIGAAEHHAAIVRAIARLDSLAGEVDAMAARHAATERDACRWAARAESAERERDALRAEVGFHETAAETAIAQREAAEAELARMRATLEAVDRRLQRADGFDGTKEIIRACLAAKPKGEL